MTYPVSRISYLVSRISYLVSRIPYLVSRISYLAFAFLSACSHSSPFTPVPPDTVGPYTDTLPRRLTFNIHDDNNPSVLGDLLVFSRQGEDDRSEYTGVPREFCISFMPVEGGTIRRTACPHDYVRLDTLVDTWFEPSLSPDGSKIAFNWMRAYRVSALGYRDSYLVVNDAANPGDTTQVRVMVQYAEAGQNPRRADIATRITWLDSATLRFLATFEQIIKVKGGGARRVTDTIMRPLALMELDLQSGQTRLVPGGDSAEAYATAPDGSIWLVREADPSLVWSLDPVTGNRSPYGRFTSAVVDLIALDGAPVAVVDSGFTVQRLDPVSRSPRSWTLFPNLIRRIAAAGNSRAVVEVEQALVPFGAPADLWLITIQ